MNTMPLNPGAASPAPASFLRTWAGPLGRLLASLLEARVRPAPGDFAREAAALRELAYGHLQSDPSFAADLFAAANRHELLSPEIAGNCRERQR